MKYALVTGGSRGIGKAVCLKFAQMGIPVLINYHSNEAAALDVLNCVQSNGGTAYLLQFDVASEQEVSNALERWEDEHPDVWL